MNEREDGLVDHGRAKGSSRRKVIGAAIGAATAYTASALGRPDGAKAHTASYLEVGHENVNPTEFVYHSTTLLRNDATAGFGHIDVFYCISQGVGTGLYGRSFGGKGVWGEGFGPSGVGVYGQAADSGFALMGTGRLRV